MTFGVFLHRTDSIYDDVPSVRYQFPKQYLSRAKEMVRDWIVYLEPSKVKETKGYFAVAKVQEIIPDPNAKDMYLAVIEPGTYLDFGDPVPFRLDGAVVERGVLNDLGRISGRAQAAVRPLSVSDFARIVELGLEGGEDILPRVGELAERSGFADAPAPYSFPDARKRIESITNRAVRDRNFRKNVLRAYGERCAITGLRLINGGGRAEVEAAHVRPVEHNGPDIVSNGLALSGTVHWMFDRGLLGLSDKLEIMVSRQVNDERAVRSMINETGHLLAPARISERPRLEFLRWHQENCFKN
ncbi:HNH endonuclease [Celeribacter neptunius]|uniref:Putative restriction endonuclease n=1 Tax=Celeribacter neptunius TaxID=588602 RepID=A0A1I3K459_9RHOB|nr:HNH endonuclease [Celeribacter neptunius]SFI67194.1 putative restriction endonuclease [Celeribacter neptunius]